MKATPKRFAFIVFLPYHYFFVNLQEITSKKIVMLHRIYIVFTSVLLAVISLSAQSNEPVKWSISAKMTSEKEGIVTIKANIESGWHIYGFTMPESGPIPTTVTFDKTTGIKFITELTASHNPIQAGNENYWTQRIRFTRKFIITGEKPHIEANVRYMSCNGNSCMPPRSKVLKVNQIRQTSK